MFSKINEKLYSKTHLVHSPRVGCNDGERDGREFEGVKVEDLSDGECEGCSV